MENMEDPGKYIMTYADYCLTEDYLRDWAVDRGYGLDLPLSIENALLSDFKPEFASSVLGTLEAPGSGLYLWGDTGVGKSHLAAAVAKHLFEENIRSLAARKKAKNQWAKFVKLRHVFETLQASFDKPLDPDIPPEWQEKNYADRLASWKGLLVVDDIGAKQKMSEWAEDVVFKIVDERYEFKRPTIYTSNLSLEALGDLFNKRITSRIRGRCRIIGMDGPDRRLAASST